MNKFTIVLVVAIGFICVINSNPINNPYQNGDQGGQMNNGGMGPNMNQHPGGGQMNNGGMGFNMNQQPGGGQMNNGGMGPNMNQQPGGGQMYNGGGQNMNEPSSGEIY